MNWELYWRYERLHRRFEPVDFRRWKRASQALLREHFPGDGVRVLDATAGLGDHTVNLAELGFLVEACDTSAEARAATREALDAAGLAGVPVHDASWERAGALLGARFDVIFHDALHWIEEPAAMHAALVGLRGALAPGGSLVFFFADERSPHEGAGLEVLAWDREHLPRHALAWSHPTGDGGHASLAVVNELAERHVDQHHLYVLRDGAGRARLEALVMRRVYRWDFFALRGALAAAGYGAPRTVVGTNDKGHEFAMNLAPRDP